MRINEAVQKWGSRVSSSWNRAGQVGRKLFYVWFGEWNLSSSCIRSAVQIDISLADHLCFHVMLKMWWKREDLTSLVCSSVTELFLLLSPFSHVSILQIQLHWLLAFICSGKISKELCQSLFVVLSKLTSISVVYLGLLIHLYGDDDQSGKYGHFMFGLAITSHSVENNPAYFQNNLVVRSHLQKCPIVSF